MALFIVVIHIILLTSSCAVNQGFVDTPVLHPDSDSDSDNDNDGLNIVFAPPLNNSSWITLQNKVPSSTRTSREGKIVISDKNIVYVSFDYSSSFYVYQWNGSSWIQAGTTITSDGDNSVTLHNNTPYISYRHNNQGIVKKLENNTWVTVYNSRTDSINASRISLHSENNKLYLMYLNADNHKLHVKYFENNNWVNLGNTPDKTYSASVNNGIKMAFYNNIPYLALADRNTSNPRILQLKNNRWENVSESLIGNRYDADSDYSFHIDSKGTVYFSYTDGLVAPQGNFEIIKFQNNTWNAAQPFNNNPLYGNETVLVQDQLYIAYTPSVSIEIGFTADSVKLGKINTQSLVLENIPNAVITTTKPSTHVSLAAKHNQFFSFYLDMNVQAYVVKGILIK